MKRGVVGTFLVLCFVSISSADPLSPFDEFRVQGDPSYQEMKLEIQSHQTLAISQSGVTEKYYDVLHYGLKLNFPRLENFFEAEADVTLLTTSPTKKIDFDFAGMTVKQVSMDQENLKWSRKNEVLSIELPEIVSEGREITLSISYEGIPSGGMYLKKESDGYFSIFTLVEPERARHWFPCYDAPNDKALSDVTVTVPNPLIVVSNGVLVEEFEDPISQTRTFHWKEQYAIATYLISIAMADYKIMQETWNGMPVQFYVTDGDQENARKTLGRTSRMLDFFQKNVAPYPFLNEKYAVAVIPGGRGAMEHTTATTFARGLLGRSYGESVAVHELAHHWWGDDVTVLDWNHLWLNEGFASYFDVLWYESLEGKDKLTQRMEGYRRTYLFEDQLSSTPIVDPNNKDFNSIFNATIYEKGAWALHMLRREMVEENFWKGIREYEKRFRYKGALTEDFQRVMEEQMDEGEGSLNTFFQQWVYKAGYPKLNVSYHYEAKEKTLFIDMKQTQDGDAYSLLLDLDIQKKNGSVLHEKVLLERREGEFAFELSQPPLGIRVDPNDWVLKDLVFQQPEDAWIAQAKSAKDWYGRLEAVRALGSPGGEEGFQTVLAVIENPKEHYLIRDVALESLGKRRDPRAFETLTKFLSDENQWIRIGAVAGLGQMQDNRAIAPLIRALKEDSASWVRASAAFGLGFYKDNPVVRTALEEAMAKDSDEDVRRVARRVLGE